MGRVGSHSSGKKHVGCCDKLAPSKRGASPAGRREPGEKHSNKKITSLHRVVPRYHADVSRVIRERKAEPATMATPSVRGIASSRCIVSSSSKSSDRLHASLWSNKFGRRRERWPFS